MALTFFSVHTMVVVLLDIRLLTAFHSCLDIYLSLKVTEYLLKKKSHLTTVTEVLDDLGDIYPRFVVVFWSSKVGLEYKKGSLWRELSSLSETEGVKINKIITPSVFCYAKSTSLTREAKLKPHRSYYFHGVINHSNDICNPYNILLILQY